MSSILVSNTEKSQADPTVLKLKKLNWEAWAVFWENKNSSLYCIQGILRKCLVGNLQNQIQEDIKTLDTHILHTLPQKTYEPGLEGRWAGGNQPWEWTPSTHRIWWLKRTWRTKVLLGFLVIVVLVFLFVCPAPEFVYDMDKFCGFCLWSSELFRFWTIIDTISSLISYVRTRV